jgi:hypothetical protein
MAETMTYGFTYFSVGHVERILSPMRDAGDAGMGWDGIGIRVRIPT